MIETENFKDETIILWRDKDSYVSTSIKIAYFQNLLYKHAQGD